MGCAVDRDNAQDSARSGQKQARGLFAGTRFTLIIAWLRPACVSGQRRNAALLHEAGEGFVS
ncbi:hypothetical protein P775_07670 [Puniceibacterium antarcticum]|uniref:Uncharacterized protein n=1 Tax=Puniceibacterium antarcticum TaxID=1206336 RepID=A0A2G8RI71_9RHOB|nr:hypothetical protein P775_07670 [Puniceibacterium antarcticum]